MHPVSQAYAQPRHMPGGPEMSGICPAQAYACGGHMPTLTHTFTTSKNATDLHILLQLNMLFIMKDIIYITYLKT
jgi:hypothetical protein